LRVYRFSDTFFKPLRPLPSTIFQFGTVNHDNQYKPGVVPKVRRPVLPRELYLEKRPPQATIAQSFYPVFKSQLKHVLLSELIHK